MVTPGGRELATWTVSGHGPPGLETVDGLARLQAAAAQAGATLVVRRMSADMAGMLDLVGLDGQVGRQPPS